MNPTKIDATSHFRFQKWHTGSVSCQDPTDAFEIFFRVDFQKAELFSLKLLASGDDFIFKSGLDVHSDNASFRCLSFKSSGLTHLHA